MYNTIAKEMLVELLFFFSFRFSSFSTCSNIIMLTSLGAKKIQECKYLKDFPRSRAKKIFTRRRNSNILTRVEISRLKGRYCREVS